MALKIDFYLVITGFGAQYDTAEPLSSELHSVWFAHKSHSSQTNYLYRCEDTET